MMRDGVSIISNDCWGGQAYKYAGIPYNTPFVGLFMMAPCYLRLLSDLQKHLTHSRFEFVPESRYEQANAHRQQKQWMYPIGILNGEMEIHFMHYKSADEAQAKWMQRSERINFGNLAVKFDCAKDGADHESIRLFDELPFRKRLVVSNPDTCTSLDYGICCDNWVMDGAKMFRRAHARMDMLDWLSDGRVHMTLKSRFINGVIVEPSQQLL
jgi:uncharacterized protein (DUF1919 family)